MRPDQQAPTPKEQPSTPSSPGAPPTPATRPKLNLQKRTVNESPAAPIGGESKASPFGGARPIDTATREREIEEKRQLAIRQKKEADEKVKAEKAEKQRQAKEQAKAEKAAAPADANGKDAGDVPQGGKNFDILRQAGDDENEEAVDHEQDAHPSEAISEKPEEPEQTSAPPSKANGNWRRGSSETTGTGDDEGWSTVGSRQRSNRRGRTAA